MSNAITAFKREKTVSSNALRRKGQVPAILYGKGMDPTMLTVEESEAQKQVPNSFVDLKVNGKTHRVMVRDIQKDPVKSSVLHIDFLKVEMNESLHAEVPIHLTGEASGEKRGGILQQQLRSVDVKALPSDLPDQLKVDISALEVGDVLQLKDVKLPDGVELITEPETVIATVVPPAKEAGNDTEEAVDTDTDTEEEA